MIGERHTTPASCLRPSMFFGTWMHLSSFLPALGVFLIVLITYSLHLLLLCHLSFQCVSVHVPWSSWKHCEQWQWLLCLFLLCLELMIPVCLLLPLICFSDLITTFFFFFFALVNLFQESLTECTGFYLPTSTSPFVGSGRGSFPLIQLFASSRYALFQLLTPPYYLALLWYALVSPRI